MIRVGVIGAAGRMGATVCNAVAADPGLELVAVVDSGAPGSTTHGLTIASELRALADAKVDVAVDFTVAEASRVNLPWSCTAFTLWWEQPDSLKMIWMALRNHLQIAIV